MPRALIRDPKANYDLPDPGDIQVVIGQRIRELRKKHRMSQMELARNLGKTSAAYIANIEGGFRNITAADLSRLAHHLKVKLSYFYP